jgi:hypothetical protein
MNIESTAKQIMSAMQSDAFNEEACVKIIHAAIEKAVSASRESDIKKFPAYGKG